MHACGKPTQAARLKWKHAVFHCVTSPPPRSPPSRCFLSLQAISVRWFIQKWVSSVKFPARIRVKFHQGSGYNGLRNLFVDSFCFSIAATNKNSLFWKAHLENIRGIDMLSFLKCVLFLHLFLVPPLHKDRYFTSYVTNQKATILPSKNFVQRASALCGFPLLSIKIIFSTVLKMITTLKSAWLWTLLPDSVYRETCFHLVKMQSAEVHLLCLWHRSEENDTEVNRWSKQMQITAQHNNDVQRDISEHMP